MQSKQFIFWEVDVQRDFMLPGGKLYVPGAENLLPNIRKLTDAARGNQVFLFRTAVFMWRVTPSSRNFRRIV
jgi:nicotinamidase-related amidase